MYALKQHVRQHQLDVEPMGPAMVQTLREPDGLVADLCFLDSVMPVEAMSYGVQTIQPSSTPRPPH
jgi:hypothetical protein